MITDKRQIGLRIPLALDRQLESLVAEIGISKQAFILNLIHRELLNNKREGLVFTISNENGDSANE